LVIHILYPITQLDAISVEPDAVEDVVVDAVVDAVDAVVVAAVDTEPLMANDPSSLVDVDL